jgi:hypothetical protein
MQETANHGAAAPALSGTLVEAIDNDAETNRCMKDLLSPRGRPLTLISAVIIFIEQDRTSHEGLNLALLNSRSPDSNGHTGQLGYPGYQSPRLPSGPERSYIISLTEVKILDFYTRQAGSWLDLVSPGRQISRTTICLALDDHVLCSACLAFASHVPCLMDEIGTTVQEKYSESAFALLRAG